MRTAVEKPGEQIYSNYTEEDFAVWKLICGKEVIQRLRDSES